MKYLKILIRILEISIERNGDQPLTVSHLLNILRMTLRVRAAEIVKEQSKLKYAEDEAEAALNEIMEDHYRYGKG